MHDIRQYFYVTESPYDTVLSTHDAHCFSKFVIEKSSNLTPTGVKLDELRKRLCEIERTRIDVFKTYHNDRIEDVVRPFVLNLFLRFISFNK